MNRLSTFLELVGVAGVAAGAAMLAPWLGLVVGGLAVAAIGVALDPPRRRDR